MFHIRNDLEIVELLRQQPIHVRKIASVLSMSPPTTMRLLRRLQQENVVDCKVEGKNNTYFLKETPEMLSYLIMLESYKRIKLFEDTSVRRIYKEISSVVSYELVVLFGSHAKGNATSRSDIDVFVETTDARLKKKISMISEKISVKSGLLRKSSALGKEIVLNHVVLNNIDRFHELLRCEEYTSLPPSSRTRRSK